MRFVGGERPRRRLSGSEAARSSSEARALRRARGGRRGAEETNEPGTVHRGGDCLI